MISTRWSLAVVVLLTQHLNICNFIPGELSALFACFTYTRKQLIQHITSWPVECCWSLWITSLFCRMTNYELLRWLIETRSRDVGHNRTLHTWASDRETFSHSVTHVARLFPVLAGLSSPAKTSVSMVDGRYIYIHHSRYFYWIQVFKSLLIISLLFYSDKII